MRNEFITVFLPQKDLRITFCITTNLDINFQYISDSALQELFFTTVSIS